MNDQEMVDMEVDKSLKPILKLFTRVFLEGTFAKRLILYLLIGIVLPIFVMMYFTITSTFDKMVGQYAEKNLSNASFFSEIIGNYYYSLKNLMTDFYSKSEYDILNTVLYDNSYNYSNYSNLYNKVKSFFVDHNEMDTIRFFSGRNNTMIILNKLSNQPTDRNDEINIYELKSLIPYFDKLNANKRQYISSTGINYRSGETVFTLNQLVLDYDNKKILSVLSMDFNVSYMDHKTADLALKKGEALFLFNKRLEVMYEKDNIKIKSQIIGGLKNAVFMHDKGINYITINNEKNLVVFSWDKYKEYLLIESIPVKYIYKDVQPIIVRDSLFMAFFIILFIIAIIIISSSVSRPVKKLVNSMKKIEKGNFEVTIDYKTYNNEFALLIDKFNLMAGEINKLFNERFKMQIAQKTAEFQALQAQINPHFLYNTLQTIQYMAVKRHAYEIDSIISALGDILKYCIRNKENIVPLSEELAYVDKFLLIQRFKFVNNLEVHLNYSEEVKSLKVPRMILQPLIENCFKHGFECNISKFRITVDCVKSGKSALIEVSDNGKGIEAEKLRELQAELGGDEEIISYSGDEVGIMNVDTRLRILYKDEYTMDISSIPFEKTTFMIKIPFPEEELA